MSRHDDHPPAEPRPHDEPQAEAPDPFLELERMFGDLAGPPASAPPPEPPPRIEPARLEIPPLLDRESEPDAPDTVPSTEVESELVLPAAGSTEEVETAQVAPAVVELDWGTTEEPAVEEPIAEESPAEESIAEEPIVVEPVAEAHALAPSVEQPAAEPPSMDPAAPAVQPAEAPPAPTPGALDELVSTLERQTPAAFDLSLAASAATPAPVGERCILFDLDGTRYALQMGQVVEVAEVPPVTLLPHVPAWLLGVSNLRGEILAVLDLRLFLDLGPRPQSAMARMLIVQGDAGLYAGLVVDAVHGVASVDMQALQPPTAPMDDPVLPLLRGVHQQDNRLLAVLDTDRLLTSDALRPFAASQASPGAAQPIYAQASSRGPSAAADAAADPFPSTS